MRAPDKLTLNILILTSTASLGKYGRPTSSNNKQQTLAGLELRGGVWGEEEENTFRDGRPICDDGFAWNALVVCRMLGFPNGTFTKESFFGNVSQDFVMDNVRCNGSEKDIRDCPHKTRSDCGEHEAAGVICSNSSVSIILDLGTWNVEVLTFNAQLMIGFIVLVLAAGVAIFIFCFWRKRVLRRATFGGPRVAPSWESKG